MSGCGCLDKKVGEKKEETEMITEEQFNKETDLISEAKEMFGDLLNTKEKETATKETVKWLKQQQDVEDAGVDEGAIWVKLKSGLIQVILTGEPGLK